MKRIRKHPRARRLSLVRWLALTLLVATAGATWAASASTIESTVRTIRTAQAPLMLGDVLILTYRSLEPTRFVGARFEHEQWRILHAYARNEFGVFVLDFAVPAGLPEVRYRIEVDGLWMSDPANPSVAQKAAGLEFSVFEIGEQPQRPLVNPTLSTAGATFVWRGPPGEHVSIVGDFNGWDPFDADSLLRETSPGVYQVTVSARPGRHYYSFFAEGVQALDPANTRTAIDPEGRRVNTFVVPTPTASR